jgi:hypothetical protein
MHPLNHVFAYHIDSTTLADGDYELILEPEVEISEDLRNVVGNLTEAPNQSSETLTLLPPAPLKKASPGHKPATLFYTAIYIYIYIYTCALSS